MSCITTVTGKHFDPTLREQCIQLQRVLRYEAKMREADSASSGMKPKCAKRSSCCAQAKTPTGCKA